MSGPRRANLTRNIWFAWKIQFFYVPIPRASSSFSRRYNCILVPNKHGDRFFMIFLAQIVYVFRPWKTNTSGDPFVQIPKWTFLKTHWTNSCRTHWKSEKFPTRIVLIFTAFDFLVSRTKIYARITHASTSECILKKQFVLSRIEIFSSFVLP